jgi:hypothetical protein
MNLVRYGFILFAVCFALLTATLVASGRHRQTAMAESVRSGRVAVEQIIHSWNMCPENQPVNLVLYLRNTGRERIAGTAVVTVAIARNSLEERFMTELIDCFGEERLAEDIGKEMERGDPGRLAAIWNYLARGKRLPPGQAYEPVTGKAGDGVYMVTFRKEVSLGPGETAQLVQNLAIPIDERGGALTVKVTDLES